jgi:hypothetical protein
MRRIIPGTAPVFLSDGARLLQRPGGGAPATASGEEKPVSIHVCVDGCQRFAVVCAASEHPRGFGAAATA